MRKRAKIGPRQNSEHQDYMSRQFTGCATLKDTHTSLSRSESVNIHLGFTAAHWGKISFSLKDEAVVVTSTNSVAIYKYKKIAIRGDEM